MEKNSNFTELGKIFLVQIHKNKPKVKRKDRFSSILQCWDINLTVNSKRIAYSKNNEEVCIKKIQDVLQNITLKLTDDEKKCDLIVFPELTIPEDFISQLLDYSKIHNVLIIGGIEHLKKAIVNHVSLSGIKTSRYKHPYRNENKDTIFTETIQGKKYFIAKPNLLSAKQYFEKSTLNIALVINGKYKYTYQIKNNPVISKKKNIKEKIPIIYDQQYLILNTQIGRIAVMICKDFLVNYHVIPQWMNFHNVEYLIIPSFSELVFPFLVNLQKFSYQNENEDHKYIYCNLAEYGGSKVFSSSQIGSYEPDYQNPDYHKNKTNEGVLIFKRVKDKKNRDKFNFNSFLPI
jgi:predicted amidohydrolase